MTPEQSDATIAEIIIPQVKPRSMQNSHRRYEVSLEFDYVTAAPTELYQISRTIDDKHYLRHPCNRKKTNSATQGRHRQQQLLSKDFRLSADMHLNFS